jgi:hypothetical protein
MGVVQQIVCLVLALLGLMSLSAFLWTLVLSDKVTHHPVFMNFICTWVIGMVHVHGIQVFRCCMTLMLTTMFPLMNGIPRGSQWPQCDSYTL